MTDAASSGRVVALNGGRVTIDVDARPSAAFFIKFGRIRLPKSLTFWNRQCESISVGGVPSATDHAPWCLR
jgi:hypothetical protein